MIFWPVGLFGLFVFLLAYNREQLRHGVVRSLSAKSTLFLASGFKRDLCATTALSISAHLIPPFELEPEHDAYNGLDFEGKHTCLGR